MSETLVRIVVIYVFLMVAFRCLGKRELGSLSPFELMTVMLIPEIVSGTLAGETSLTHGLAGVSVLFLLVFTSSLLAHLFPRFARLSQAAPTVLVDDGKLCVDALNRERISPDEILAEMHKRGLTHFSAVRWAILEGGGSIAIVPREGLGVPADERRAGVDA